MEINEDVVIIGAGIAGLATAVALKRVGIPSLVLERSDKLRTTGSALTLFPNAWQALDALSVSHKLTSVYNPTSKVTITDLSTGDVQEVCFTENNGPRSVHRNALLEALAEELPANAIRFSSNFTSIQEGKQDGDPIVILHLEDGTIIKSKVLIGCDGVHSKVAKWLGLSEPVHAGRSAVRGLAIYPQGHGFKHDVMQFVDVGKRAGLVPLNDNQLYWFLTYKQDKNCSNDSEDLQNEVLSKYAKDFPSIYLDAVQHADVANISWAPLLLRKPWDLIFGKNLRKGNIITIGDAMHPMTPDLGQGGGSALEDAVVLGRLIGNSFIKNKGRIVSKEMGEVFDGFVQERKWRVAILITVAYVSGWVQQSGSSSWWKKFLRDDIFYGFLYPKIFNIIRSYNCGTLRSDFNKLD